MAERHVQKLQVVSTNFSHRNPNQFVHHLHIWLHKKLSQSSTMIEAVEGNTTTETFFRGGS